MEPRAIKGTDWARHEEKVAKIRHDLGNSNVWDIGMGKELMGKLPQYEPSALAEQINEMVTDGFWMLNVDSEKVYVYKDSEGRRLEIGVRADFVEMWSEKKVAELEAMIARRSDS
jgi:hypothetical protein